MQNLLPRHRSLALAWAIMLASAVVSILIWGFRYGIRNNEFHAILVETAARGVVFANDAMASTMQDYVSIFWLVVAYLSSYLPVEGVFCFFLLIGRILLTIGVALIIRGLFKEASWLKAASSASVVTIASGFMAGLPLGADPVMGDYLSQTYVSVGICAVAIGLAFNGRQLLSAVILGVAYNVNAMQANFALGIATIIWIEASVSERSVLLFPKAFLIFLLIASPNLYWILSVTGAKATGLYLEGARIADFTRFIFPFHFFWSVKGISQKINGVSLALLPLAISIASLAFKEARLKLDNARWLFIASVISLLYIFAGAVGAEAFPSRFILQLHFFRSDVLIYLIAVSAFISLILRNAGKRDSLFAVLLLALAAFLAHQFHVALLIFIWGVVMEKKSPICRWVAILAPVIIVIYGLMLAYTGRFFGVPMALAALLSAILKDRNVPLQAAIALFIVVSVSFSFYMERAVVGKEGLSLSDEIRLVAKEASAKVPKDAAFLIPPNYTVRPFLKRGVFVTMKDGGAFMWAKGYELEYIRRLNLLSITYTPGKFYDEKRVEEEFISGLGKSLLLMKGEGVGYAILPKRALKNAPHDLITESEHFLAFEISSLSSPLKDN